MTRDDEARRETILQAAKELRSDEPVPDVEELVEFVTGKSSPEVTERVREHVAFEKAPRQMVRDLAALQRGEEGGELSEQEVEDDWRTLLARIEAEPTEESLVEAPVGERGRQPSRNQTSRERFEDPRRQPASRRRWRQKISDVLAASFLLTTIGLGYQVLTTDEDVLGFSEVITLDENDSQTRGDQPKDASWKQIEVVGPAFVFSLKTEDPSLHTQFTSLEIKFFDATGDDLKSIPMDASTNPRDPPKVFVSRDWLPSGRYRIVLLGHDAHQQTMVPIGEYQIRLNYVGEPPD